MNTLTLNESRSIIAPAETRVDEIGQPMNIAVVDAGGNLAHARQMVPNSVLAFESDSAARCPPLQATGDGPHLRAPAPDGQPLAQH
jgi:hypothetical protein